MKTRKILAILVMALGLIVCQAKVSEAAPMGTAFTYQGHLYDANYVADGLYDFQFKLFDDPNVIVGNQVGSDVNKPDVDVIDGYFTVELDFNEPNAFGGDTRWLEIGVRPGEMNDPNVYTTLSPRQEVTPTPYAIYAETAGAVLGGMGGSGTANYLAKFTSGNTLGDSIIYENAGNVGIGTTNAGYRLVAEWDAAYNINPIAVFRTTGTNSAGAIRFQNANNNKFNIGITANDEFAIAYNNNIQLATDLLRITSTGNVGIGTTGPTYTLDVAGSLRADGLRVEPNEACPNLIGGRNNNTVTSGVAGATIGGGGTSLYPNRVTDYYGTVAGGVGNRAGDNAGTTMDARNATVGGGAFNYAGGFAATITGGYDNQADELYATVGGGFGNRAWGEYATVPGGHYNIADGDYSFAAGRRTRAYAPGCFVWGDSTDENLTCNNDNRWVARASGGVYFYTSSDLSTGAYLASGSGSWSSVSDLKAKDNFAPVDSKDVLEKLVRLPIKTWKYKPEVDSIRHIGPMAQDLYAAFGLGDSDKAICAIDADGISFAAIQGLYQLVQGKDAEIAALKKQNEKMEVRLAAMEALVAKLARQHEGGAK